MEHHFVEKEKKILDTQVIEGKQACQLFRYLGFRERLCRTSVERKAIGLASQGCLCSDRKVEAGSTPLRIRTGAFNKRRAGLRCSPESTTHYTPFTLCPFHRAGIEAGRFSPLTCWRALMTCNFAT